jgi:anti-sigma-K factor RskA
MSRDHSDYLDEVGAYLLGALSELERQAFERHLEGCVECREEVARLRPAADSLPRSVEQHSPSPSLRSSIMDVVNEEAREHSGKPARVPLGERLLGLLPSLGGQRPAFAALAATVLLMLGVAGGFGASRLLTGDEARTVTASKSSIRSASASLRIPGAADDGAILRVHGLPPLQDDRTYQAWVRRGSEIVPQPTFDVREDGTGEVAVPEDLSAADEVMVTRELRGGSPAPSAEPILRVSL